MSSDNLVRLRSLFIEVLAPLAETLDAFVVDGGTDGGVMRLMGQDRADCEFSMVSPSERKLEEEVIALDYF